MSTAVDTNASRSKEPQLKAWTHPLLARQVDDAVSQRGRVARELCRKSGCAMELRASARFFFFLEIPVVKI